MSGLAEEDVDESAARVWAKRGLMAVAVIAASAGVVFVAKQLTAPPGAKQKQMAKIRIVPDTPPPPPPPKEERRPEPPKEAKQVNVERPKEPAREEVEQLKMEGQGSDDGLAGLAAGPVTSEYSGQVIGSADGSRFAWYKGVLQSQVQGALQRKEDLRNRDFRVVVRIWLAADGAVVRSELMGSTGDADLDQRVRTALAQLPPISERPPEGLPQPVTMRLISSS